jgi:hypothetical protein
MRQVRVLFLKEGAALAGAGALAGSAAAAAYCGLILEGLRTWWFDAVGTRLISLHVSLPALAAAAGAGVATGLLAIVWSLRRLAPGTPRGMLEGAWTPRPAGRLWWGAGAAALASLGLVGAGLAGKLDHTAGFFGAGSLLLAASLLGLAAWLRGRRATAIRGVFTLGLRHATYRPGRSILCIALIAAAAFITVVPDTFRRADVGHGTGGFPLLAESAVPLIHNPGTAAGREALGLPPMAGAEILAFRLRPGDDASCLNLYRPRSPRILAPPPAFLRRARFTFQEAPAGTQNPWLLLEAPQPGGAIPAIADANSLEYVLHWKVGGEYDTGHGRFRIVAALRDSLFQGELLISEANFLRLFPDTAGYRFFLLNAPPERAGELEAALADYGFDVQSADARLRAYHRVENTYLATFSALGALGLALGTVGLGAVLLRNALERRRELALLRAAGYRPLHLAVMVLAENLFLLTTGLVTGAACALVAAAPAALERGGRLPLGSLSGLLGVVLATGMLASLAATRLALRAPLLTALRSE